MMTAGTMAVRTVHMRPGGAALPAAARAHGSPGRHLDSRQRSV